MSILLPELWELIARRWCSPDARFCLALAIRSVWESLLPSGPLPRSAEAPGNVREALITAFVEFRGPVYNFFLEWACCPTVKAERGPASNWFEACARATTAKMGREGVSLWLVAMSYRWPSLRLEEKLLNPVTSTARDLQVWTALPLDLPSTAAHPSRWRSGWRAGSALPCNNSTALPSAPTPPRSSASTGAWASNRQTRSSTKRSASGTNMPSCLATRASHHGRVC